MNPAAFATGLGERIAFPDFATLKAIDMLVGRTRRKLARANHADTASFAEAMRNYPIAMHADEANAQHYEVPAAFFETVLGPQRKYSCCLYDGAATLAEAEEAALAATAGYANLTDGQRILELGCGWGSLSLWMARHFPGSRIVAVSNSHSQGAAIRERSAVEGLTNLEVLTADMNGFAVPGTFDRIVSVEMFEHMANWRPLLAKARAALNPDGRMYVHIFSHKSAAYRFDHTDPADWIARHFFTGGIMPSHDLMREFGDLFAVEQEWRWSGKNYERTAAAWLDNFDRNAETVEAILREVYGNEWRLWRRRWRLFFLATRGLFGHGDGSEWAVSHYQLAPV
ncbi:cyclopropane-fatty-acyl-phospholipid synthase family protein [uncultured Nitratireductor sp.]|uniref:SAM-dependent methyltransferase n=1 Tax=uncultured Nitratireductor sp. TaxID=520953 RepID=UPI0025F82EE6|nr:cyclopropane-fatty-acyl-phospholipid synthase family protein [uncultured Nitratireductor sp.]